MAESDGGDRERRGGDSGGRSTPAERRLAPLEREAADQHSAELAHSSLDALTEYEKNPARTLGRAQQQWARAHAPDRLRVAQEHAQRTQQANESQQHIEHRRKQAEERERASLLVANLRAAIVQAAPGLERDARTARMAGTLTPDGTHAVLRGLEVAVTRTLTAAVTDGATKAAIRVVCARIARGETIDGLSATLESVAAKLDQVLKDKTHGNSHSLFDAIPDAAAIAQGLMAAGQGALAKATGRQQSPAPAMTAAVAAPDLAPKRARDFPTGKLHGGDEPEGLSDSQWFNLISVPHPDGPSIVGPFPIKVAGVVVKHQSFLIWTTGGKVSGWMPASDIPVGGSRSGDWLLWSDGNQLQVVRDRPTDTRQLQAHAPEMSAHDIERRRDADAELNRDLESYVATGSSIQQAQSQVLAAHRDVLAELVQGTFRIFSVMAGVMASEGAIEATGDALGRLGSEPPGKVTEPATPKVGPQSQANETVIRRDNAAPPAAREADTVALFVKGELPPTGAARWAYIENPEVWPASRRAIHDELLEAALREAQTFADAFAPEQQPTLYAMRGNTAAGKSRALKQAPAVAAPLARAKNAAVNPDNFKQRLMAEGNFTSSQVHSESSMLSSLLERRLLGIRRTNQPLPGDLLIDKRLATVDDVRQYAEMAKSSQRAFSLCDVDAPLETSFAGVLERPAGGPDPLPPYAVVSDGFDSIRRNRLAVIDLFRGDPTFGQYELYAATPSGERVKVARVIAGKLDVLDGELFAKAIAQSGEEAGMTGDTPITEDLIERMTANLDPKRALTVRSVLRKYLGETWKAALDAHSTEKPPAQTQKEQP